MYLRNLASKYLQSITIFTPFFVNEINIQVAFPLKIIFVILLHFFFGGGGIQHSINWYGAGIDI